MSDGAATLCDFIAEEAAYYIDYCRDREQNTENKRQRQISAEERHSRDCVGHGIHGLHEVVCDGDRVERGGNQSSEPESELFRR